MVFKKGFTLIELLVVITIIGILAAMLTQNFYASRVRASDVAIRSGANGYRQALELYHNLFHTYLVSGHDPNSGLSGCSFSYNGAAYTSTSGYFYRLQGTSGSNNCGGFHGSGEGKITRKSINTPAYPSSNSIADLLVEAGVLSRIQTYPGVSSFTENQTGGTADNDFILTLCDGTGKEAASASLAGHYAIYAELQRPSDLETSIASGLCGGHLNSNGWDTLQAQSTTGNATNQSRNLNYGVGN